MPNTPQEDRRFYKLLRERQSVGFDEVLAVFTDRKGKLNLARTREQLNFLWVEDVFTLLGPAGEVVSWNEEAPYREPARYRLRFDGFEGLERNRASQNTDTLTEITEVLPGFVWAYPQRRRELRVLGDQAAAAVLAERLRAFTQQFAFHLVTGQHALIAGQFSSRAAKGQTLETLLTRIANLEKEYGPFDYFDRVMVTMVFSPPFAPVKEKQLREDFPREIPDTDLRGHSEFEIVSVRTPNGMRVHEMTVMLRIVEEAGFFRIADAACHAGY